MTYLYQRPVIDIRKVAEITATSSATAYKLIADFEKMEILHEITGSQRGKIYVFKEYLNLFK